MHFKKKLPREHSYWIFPRSDLCSTTENSLFVRVMYRRRSPYLEEHVLCKVPTFNVNIYKI